MPRVNRTGPDLPLAVTAGEPAGIGPELCLALTESRWADRLVVIGDPRVLRARAARLGRRLVIREYDADDDTGLRADELRVLAQAMPNPEVCGSPDPANAESLLAGLRLAVDGCRRGLFAAMVTAPLQKSTINEAGIPFTGHTEFLADAAAAGMPVMLLVAGKLRVALATTHLPLREVADALTAERLARVLDVLHADLTRQFRVANPKILVCGLNPHAGEGGHLGREEQTLIRPVIERLQARGLDIRGPVPADTAFIGAAETVDAVLAMYHDQGLPVLKYAGFGKAVNVTLGLPFVRTSVDHGTALDIAGTGKADVDSMLAAVELAADIGRGAATAG